MAIRPTASRTPSRNGFTLIELLLVLAIIGMISAIAIPTFLGQRRRAKVIGDASANARVLAMQLETYKTDRGTYGTEGASVVWKASDATPPAGYESVQFTAKGNSTMDYTLDVGAGGVTYTITVNEIGGGTKFYQINQAGTELYRYQ